MTREERDNQSHQKKLELCQNIEEFIHPEFCTSLGTHITILTADKKILFCERGKSVFQSQGKFTCGAVETIDSRDCIPSFDVYRASGRGLWEELGLEFSPDFLLKALKITALMCKPDCYEWGFVGYLDARFPNGNDAPTLTSQMIQSIFDVKFPRDRWETFKLHFVDFEPFEVIKFLKKHKGNVVNSAVACSIYTLKSIFNRECDDMLFKVIYQGY